MSSTEPTLGSTSAAVPPPADPQPPSLRDVLITSTRASTSFTAKGWQLDAAISIVEKKDIMIVAGTGEGKTLPFVMPLFAFPDQIVIIVSPLNAIEAGQV
jgi:hypothetical protein